MKPQQLTLGQRAQSALRERGWRQGPYDRDYSGRLCILEALSVATDEPTIPRVAIKSLGFAHTGEAVDWNDAPGRTVEEVLERLERV